MRPLPWILLLMLAATGCRRTTILTSVPAASTANTLVPGTMITAPGSWTYSDSKITRVLIVKVTGSNLSWSLSRTERHPGGSSRGSSSSSLSISSPGDPWFIFVERPEKIWFFNGSDNLNYNFSANGGSEGGTAISGGQLTGSGPDIPIEVIRSLPDELRKLVPHVEPPAARPSL